MESIKVQANSSGDMPYDVEFIKDEGTLSIHCSCPAGEHQQLCKHKMALVCGDNSMLYSQQQLLALERISKWVKETDYLSLVGMLKSLEEKKESISKNIKSLKRKIARVMNQGLPIKNSFEEKIPESFSDGE